MNSFPENMPDDVDNLAKIQGNDWVAFQSLSAMEDHWQRQGWAPGRRSYHWMLSFHDADRVRDLAGRCQESLVQAALDLVPLDALHLTVGRIGFTDELSPDLLLPIADAAWSRCRGLEPIDLTVGPLAGSGGAIRFSVGPWTCLLELHRELSEATRTMLGERCLMDTADFRPHISIAYANRTIPIASLLPTVERLRQLPTEPTTVRSALLVELRREGHVYRYNTVTETVLGGSQNKPEQNTV